MQSFVTFYENFYKQGDNVHWAGDRYVYRAEGNPDNLELVAGEVNKFVPITGSNSKDINKLMKSRAFVGYDVYSKKGDGNMKDAIYATVKGTANRLGGEGYRGDRFTPMSEEHYSSLLDRSVNAFVNTVNESYDFILWPQSASRNVMDIAERLEAGLGRRFPDTEIVVGQINKKLINLNTIGAVLSARDDAVVDVESLLARAHKAFMDAAVIGYRARPYRRKVPRGFDKELTEILEDYIVSRLETWVRAEGTQEGRDGVPFSNTRHLRPWNLQSFFAPLITEIKNEDFGVYISLEAGHSFLPLQKQAEGQMDEETGRMKSDIRINGRMQNVSRPLLTFEDLISSFQKFARDRRRGELDPGTSRGLDWQRKPVPARDSRHRKGEAGRPHYAEDEPRFLIVDDNINTGDIFKQLTPIYDLHDQHFNDGRAAAGHSRKQIDMDFFFLMKDVKALTKG